jgi:photosystem II stability/assembly factor-like uncharacterized protein
MNRFAAQFLALVLGAGALALAGCGDKTTNPPPAMPYESIVISAADDTLSVGQILVVTAAVTDTAGNPVPLPSLSWLSSAPSVARAEGNGRVTARSEGTAIITATGGGVTSNPETLVVVPGVGWVDQSSTASTTNNLNGVYFRDLQNGWAVGDLGVVLATVDGGFTWDRQASRTSRHLHSVYFTSATHGFAVGEGGTVLETLDGGSAWDLRAGSDVPTSGLALHDVFFLGSDLGFIVGNAGLILRTTDGGATWARVQSGATQHVLSSVSVTDVPGPDTLAWAVGDQGVIVGSRDAGRTWRLFTQFVTGVDWKGVVRRSNTEAVAAGQLGTVARTVASADSATWELATSTGASLDLDDVAWPAADRLYVAGQNTLAGVATVRLSVDGGQTWSIQTLPGTGPIGGNEIRSLWFVDADHGWAVGRSGLILHTSDGGGP